MGKKQLATGPAEITIKLSDPGMTALHKVGLAGLWMTLQAFDRETRLKKSRPRDADWKLDNRSVTLMPGRKPRKLLKWLFDQSFKLKNGLFSFPALGDPTVNYEHSVVLQNALLGSFLQHGRTRKADTTIEAKGICNITIDDKPYLLVYRKVYWYAHQREQLNPDKLTPIAGWLNPGGAVRHSGFQNATALEEPFGRALALAFAPIGSIYFEIKSRGERIRPQYAIVMPEITNLAQYAKARQRFVKYGVQRLYAAGESDAGMRVLAELKAAGMLENIQSAHCRVVSFGVVPWSTQQKTRVHLMDIRVQSLQALYIFEFCRTLLAPKLIRHEKIDPFWDVPVVPDLVARNLSEGRGWYIGFADLLTDRASREHITRYERGGLAKMTENNQILSEGPDRTFVLACQEALRRHMGKKHGRPGGVDWGTEYEKVRVAIARCKNAATLRETITDFWARGGTLHRGDKTLLHAGDDWWQQVLPMFSDSDWRRAKDLALLALASYPTGKE